MSIWSFNGCLPTPIANENISGQRAVPYKFTKVKMKLTCFDICRCDGV
jgi:hypothetical protein